MARDIGDLAGSGWSLESLTLYDFYPQTGNIEALARLMPPRGAT
jgi:tRNA/tmRNA/rRNA uracil-C5-methylase (TrmA/RlmC/RlmD family)